MSVSEGPKHVLYASYVSPFPANSGERIRALNLIGALRWLGYTVEALVGNHDEADLSAHGRDGVNFRQIAFAWPRLRQATDVYFRAHPEFVRQVLRLHEERKLRAIILDYGFMGAQISALSRLGIPVLLGTHNLESTITGLATLDSRRAWLALRLRQAIEFAHERWFFRRADGILCVSDEDRRLYASFVPKDRLHVVPNFIDVPDHFGDVIRQNRIIMTGSFSNFQNVRGLGWFVENVWDEELQARANLCVAGKLSDRVVREFEHVPGIIGLGARDDLLREIARSRCAVVPIWEGSGTRLKCLEAMAVRTPVVTTSKGCEGIDHGGAFRVADSAAEFKAAILDLLGDPEHAARSAAQAREAYDQRYSLAANAKRLAQAMATADEVRLRRQAVH
jgi:glycosyltransferase involved in cell wall biosynthesis